MSFNDNIGACSSIGNGFIPCSAVIVVGADELFRVSDSEKAIPP